jgi:hypothetical protein
LYKISLKKFNTPLTCDECFVLLEHIAEELSRGNEATRALEAVRQHLAHCPRCREHHLQRLRALEAQLLQIKKRSK